MSTGRRPARLFLWLTFLLPRVILQGWRGFSAFYFATLISLRRGTSEQCFSLTRRHSGLHSWADRWVPVSCPNLDLSLVLAATRFRSSGAACTGQGQEISGTMS